MIHKKELLRSLWVVYNNHVWFPVGAIVNMIAFSFNIRISMNISISTSIPINISISINISICINSFNP